MKDLDNIPSLMADIGARAREASHALAFASAERKHAALSAAADAVKLLADMEALGSHISL